MSDNEHRIRLVLLGGPCVGKSAIIQRFLYNQFSNKYKSTVEDLYNREYDIGQITLKVDILDTAGDNQFPAMRRLSIATAHAFLLVYCVNQVQSFENVRLCIEEIKEQRRDYEEIPIVIAGNKIDMEVERQVFKEDVTEWLYGETPGLRCRVVECSAKENLHVKDIFRTFLHIGRLPPKEEGAALKRQASAYSKHRPVRRTGSPSGGAISEASGSTAAAPPSPSLLSRSKPRSRSLIRRSSRKAKQQVRDSQAEDCSLS